jgi:FdhD protein
MKERSDNRKVLSIREGETREEERPVVQETPLTIFLNGKELITLLTTGDANRELAIGFLLSEGFLNDPRCLESIREDPSSGTVDVNLSGDLSIIEKLWGKRTVTSGCGKGATFYHVLDSLHARQTASGVTVSPSRIRELMDELNRLSGLYRKTGGVHNCALADIESILVFRDDIGRHNAVDKIYGNCFLENIPMEDKLLLTTGRISSEMTVKTIRMGVSVLISRSAPTSLALDLAERAGLTVVGYVRGGGMVVYTGKERIKV